MCSPRPSRSRAWESRPPKPQRVQLPRGWCSRRGGARASVGWWREAAPAALHPHSIEACLAARGGCGILDRAMTHVSFRILGRLEALVDGRVSTSEPRRASAAGRPAPALGEVVSIDALIDSVWDEHAPVSARTWCTSTSRGSELRSATPRSSRPVHPGIWSSANPVSWIQPGSPSSSARRAPLSPRKNCTTR